MTVKQRRREVTVAEVAKLAGVGKATASRALGGYGAVSDSARSRVLSAAEQLGYRPNGVARAMNTGTSKTIGVVVGDIENGYFGLAVRGISDVAQAAGYDVILLNTDEDIRREIDAVHVLLDKRVDGLIIAPTTSYKIEHLRDVISSGRPLVLLDRRIEAIEAPAIWADLATATELAVDDLIGHGHRRIAFISAIRTDGVGYSGARLGVSSVGDRIEGIVRSLAKHGIPFDAELLRYQAVDVEAVRRIVIDLLESAEPPTALIASDSTVALSILRVLRDRGLVVPSDVSLVVLDALEWTEFARPPLAAVVQPTYAIGERTARTLFHMLKGAPMPRSVPFTAEYTPRESIAPPAVPRAVPA